MSSVTNQHFTRIPAGFYRAEGIIKNVNTIEDYKKLDKPAVLNRAGRTVCYLLPLVLVMANLVA
jgi:hypothetical protein